MSSVDVIFYNISFGSLNLVDRSAASSLLLSLKGFISCSWATYLGPTTSSAGPCAIIELLNYATVDTSQ